MKRPMPRPVAKAANHQLKKKALVQRAGAGSSVAQAKIKAYKKMMGR